MLSKIRAYYKNLPANQRGIALLVGLLLTFMLCNGAVAVLVSVGMYNGLSIVYNLAR